MFHINVKTKRVHAKNEIQKGIYNESKIEKETKKENKQEEESMIFVQECRN